MSGSLDLNTQGSMSADMNRIDGRVVVTDLDWDMGTGRLRADSMDLTLRADSTIEASFNSGDIMARAVAYTDLKTIMKHAEAVPAVIDSILAKRSFDVIALEQALPQMDMSMTAGPKNFVSEYLAASKTAFRQAALGYTNDSLIHLSGRADGVRTGETRLDTLRFDANQKGQFIVFSGCLNPRPGTLDQFAHGTVIG